VREEPRFELSVIRRLVRTYTQRSNSVNLGTCWGGTILAARGAITGIRLLTATPVPVGLQVLMSADMIADTVHSIRSAIACELGEPGASAALARCTKRTAASL